MLVICVGIRDSNVIPALLQGDSCIGCTWQDSAAEKDKAGKKAAGRIPIHTGYWVDKWKNVMHPLATAHQDIPV
jgi:hypothetical protein